MALSSTAEEADETEEMDPLRIDMFVWTRGGEVPETLDMLILRRFAWAAAEVIGPG